MVRSSQCFFSLLTVTTSYARDDPNLAISARLRPSFSSYGLSGLSVRSWVRMTRTSPHSKGRSFEVLIAACESVGQGPSRLARSSERDQSTGDATTSTADMYLRKSSLFLVLCILQRLWERYRRCAPGDCCTHLARPSIHACHCSAPRTLISSSISYIFVCFHCRRSSPRFPQHVASCSGHPRTSSCRARVLRALQQT